MTTHKAGDSLGQERSALDAAADPALGWPGTYRFQVQSALRPGWADWFGGLDLATGKDEHGRAVTTLTGEIPDQAALHGVLNRIRDLGLTLVLVERLEPRAGQGGRPDSLEFEPGASQS